MLQYRAIELFLMVLNGSIQGRIPWWHSTLIAAFSLNCEYAISFFFWQRGKLFISDSTCTYSGPLPFTSTQRMRIPQKRVLISVVISESISQLKICCRSSLEILGKDTFRWVTLMWETVFHPVFYILWYFFKFYCYIILSRLCTSVLIASLSCLQIRWSCANLASVTSSWLVHRPLC